MSIKNIKAALLAGKPVVVPSKGEFKPQKSVGFVAETPPPPAFHEMVNKYIDSDGEDEDPPHSVVWEAVAAPDINVYIANPSTMIVDQDILNIKYAWDATPKGVSSRRNMKKFLSEIILSHLQ